jgi:predicted  nucleic acid-binding Zn-ribbon protein
MCVAATCVGCTLLTFSRQLSERNQQLEEQVDELNAELQHVNDRLSATEEKFVEETQLLSRKNAALKEVSRSCRS